MSKRQPEAIKAVIAELEQECAPALQSYLEARGTYGPDDEVLARVVNDLLRQNSLAMQHATSAMSLMIAQHFVERTDRDNLSCAQLQMFDTAADVREFLRHATHRCGDGTTILQSFMTREQVIARHERKRTNKARVDAAFDESQRFTDGILHYMDAGLSYEDAAVSLRDELATS
jgi:hypothetical protein